MLASHANTLKKINSGGSDQYVFEEPGTGLKIPFYPQLVQGNYFIVQESPHLRSDQPKKYK